MVTRNLLEVKNSWPKKHRSWNQQFIPKKLAELDSYEEVDPGAAPFARGVLPAPLEDGTRLNPLWEETMDEEDLEPASIQSIIRKSLIQRTYGK